MADVNANIGIHIDSSAALAELKTLQRQLATFHASIAKNSAASAAAQKGLQQNLLNSINATGKFHAQMGLVRTSTESFTHALENNKLSMREYFRYAGASSKSFGKLFKSEFDTIGKVAEERVRKMQTQYIKMGRDASGALKAMSVTPATLNMKDYANQTAVAAQKQAMFNQLVKQGSTSLLNFGKNTQWAGRQLMVGFSVPLMYIGSIASKTFMEMEEQAIRFKRVYGDIFTSAGETEKAVKNVEDLAKSFTKYGVAFTETMKMAADAAAMGKTGAELTAQISEATRLAVLGGVEQQQALETTISLTNAFGIASDKLASKINFLNAVENQTVVSIEDLTIAIPKAGPVIQQLGGDVEDLAFFLTAMKEGGINASEGANALKSGLAALINPSKKAAAMLMDLGVNITGIVEGNAGDLQGTVVGFAKALDTLDPLNRARAIEQLFGKFQFARLSTLFKNITTDGTQASKVLKLTEASVEELAIMSERELKRVEDAVGVNFKQSVEDLKISIMPIGKAFLEALTPIVKFAADILKKFDGLGDGTKKFIVVATTLVGILGPTLLMTFGLVANGAANIIKLFLALRTGFLKLGGNATVLSQQTSYLNAEQLEAATVAASLNQAHTRLTQSFTLETSAVMALRNAYVQATTAALTFARANPGMMMPGFKGSAPKKFKQGATYVPGSGNKDTVPSMLTPGEAVIPRDVAQNPAYQPIIDAMVNGNLQGFNKGTAKVGTIAGTVDFGGKTYRAASQETAMTLVNEINSQMEAAKLGGYDTDAERLIKNRMDDLSTVSDKRPIAKPLTKSIVFKHIKEGKSTSGGAKSNNPAIKSARTKLNAANKAEAVLNVSRETEQVAKQLKAAGFNDKQIRDFTTKSEAHILDSKDKSTKWLAGQTVQDYKGLNTYLNRAGGKEVGNLVSQINKFPEYFSDLGYSKKQIRQLSYDYAFAQTKKHPTSQSEFERIARLADLEDRAVKGRRASQDIQKNIHQAKGVIALSKARTPEFYKKFYKKVLQLGEGTATPVKRGKVESIDLTKAKDFQAAKIFTETDKDVNSSRFKNEAPLKLGKQISQSSGYSFREANHISGVFEKPDGSRVFVKPMMDEKAALAEQRATIIAREAHGLEAPEQKLRVIQDPKTGKKLFALESPYDPRFAESNFTGKFTKQEYFKQLVAANLRGDKDLHSGNLSGKTLADVGTAGVFAKASGKRDFATKMPSMAEQANINLLGEKGGAKRFFAEATLDIPKGMTADQYHNSMIKEIDEVLPKLKKTVAGFNLNPEERKVYQGMISRLEEGRKVDWRTFHKIHSGVVVAVQKKESIQDAKGKITKVTGQNTTALPKGVKPSTGRPDDSRVATVKPGSKVVTQRPGKFRVIPGKADAPGVNQFGMQPIDQAEFKKQSDALKANAGALDENTAQTKASSIKTKDLAHKSNVAMGAVSGMALAASFAGGKLGEMAQGIMPFVFGLQGIVALMPMLANPWVAAVAAISVLAVSLVMMNKQVEDARKEGVGLANAMSMTSKKLTALSVMTGTVSASEEAAKRRENIASGTTEAQRTVGQNLLESDFGKNLLGDIDILAKSGLTSDAIAKNVSTGLSQAVLQGVITTEQARSIASALGEKLGSYEIPAKISGNLVQLLGPDGSNLYDNPLEVALKIKADTYTNVQDAFEQALTGANASAVGKSLNGWKKAVDVVSFTVGGGSRPFQDNAVKARNAKLDAAAVQLGAEAISQNQKLVDSVTKEYDIKIKNAKTEKEILALQAEKKTKVDDLNIANAETLKQVQQLGSGLGSDDFTKAINASIDTLYKDSSDAVKAFVGQAKDNLTELSDTPFKKTIQLGFASGELSASTVLKILEYTAENKNLEGVINLSINEQGFADTALMTDLFVKTGADAKTIEVLFNYVNKNKEGFDTDIAAVQALADMKQNYDVALNLKANGATQIINTTRALAAIKDLPDQLNFKLVQELAGTNPLVFQGIKDNWAELSQQKDSINKNLVVNYGIGSIDPELQAAASAAGLTVAEFVAKGFVAPTPTIIKDTSTPDKTTPKPRNTTLDELLKKLKFVRDAAINAEGNINSLVKIVSGKGITKFAGVSQQLMAGMKGGFNREFISMLESMDNKTRDIYMRVEKGKVVLTKQGEALKVAFNEKVIGEFQDTQVRAVQDSVAQQAAFVKLKAAGVDTSTALEMVSDANLAVAINAKKITSKEINELAKSAVAAKNPVSTLAIELEKAANAARQKMVDVTNQIKILTEAKTKMGLSTEDLKIISEDPVLMKALEKLLNGDGTRKQLGEFENLIRSTINNIKGAKVKVEGDFTALTEGIEVALQNSANKAQAIFDKLSADIQKGLDLRRASIEKTYRDQIKTAQTAVDEIQKTIDDGYDPATKLIIPGLQSKVDAAQEAINASNDSYDALVKSIEDTYLKETLDDLGNIVSSGLLAKPQAEVDRLTKSIEDLQNKGGINAKSLTDFGATNANDNLTLAEAEKAIADVQGFIETTYSRPIEMLQQAIAGQQRTLEITYTRSIEEIQKKIEDIQTKIAKEFDKPLSKIQEESTKLSEDLAVMDNAADAINKKYETQENALTKIAEINQDIVEQQKQQLGLADALSKGDISAAAAAVQDIRATQAAKALGAQQGTLGKAREAELAAIKSPSGLTRDQIAERQYALERSSYQIQQLQKVEQEKILALQEKIYNIENDPARIKILSDVKAQEDEIYRLDNLRLLANNAIYTVQGQITTRNNEISAQQVLLTKAQTDLKVVEDAREAELKKAEIAHAEIISGLKDKLTLAEDNLKKANDALVIAQAALKDIEGSRAKAMAEVESDEQKFKDMVTAIDLATASTVLFEDQLTAAKTAANNLKTALENLTIAKDAESKAEIKRQQDAAQAEANRKAAEKKAAEEKAAEEKAAAELKAKEEADAKNNPPPPRIIPKGRFAPQYISSGGMVPKYFAAGGFSKGTDTIPAMLTPGEFVIKKSAVDSYGVNNLSKINSGISPDSSVYNYSLSVNVSGNNLNADDIASTVMQKIKYIDGQRVRGQR